MIYLIIKFLLLFVIALLCGAALATWWFRRRYEDVSETYSYALQSQQVLDSRPWDDVMAQLTTQKKDWLEALDARFAALDLSGNCRGMLLAVEDRLATLEGELRRAHAEDFKPLTVAIADLPGELQKATGAEVAQATAPLGDGLQRLEERVAQLGAAVAEAATANSPTPVIAAIEAVQAGLSSQVDGLLATIPAQLREQFADLAEQLASIRAQLAQAGEVQLGAADFERRIATVELGVAQQLQQQRGAVTDVLQELGLKVDGTRERLTAVLGLRDQLQAAEDARQLDAASHAAQLQDLNSLVRSVPALAAKVDVIEIRESMDSLREGLSALLASGNEDVAVVRARSEQALEALQGLAASPLDLTGLFTRIDQVETVVRDIPRPVIPEAPDLAPLVERLNEVEKAVKSIPLPQVAEPDLSPLLTRMAAVEEALLGIPTPTVQEAPDLAPLHARLVSVQEFLSSLSPPPAVEAPDLSPLTHQLDALERQLGQLPRPLQADDLNEMRDGMVRLEAALRSQASAADVAQPLTVGLAQLHTQLAALSAPDLVPLQERVRAVELAIHALPQSVGQDLGPLLLRLDALEANLRNWSGTFTETDLQTLLSSWKDTLGGGPSPTVEFGAIQQQLTQLAERLSQTSLVEGHGSEEDQALRGQVEGLQQAIATMNRRFEESQQDSTAILERLASLQAALIDSVHTPSVDLEPIAERLDNIEQRLSSWTGHEREAEGGGDSDSRRSAGLLRNPSHGPRDDLKVINGVGPKLERMLNDLGVYYFWQIARWTPENVQYVDDKLDVFKGRIERDDWIRQAAALQRTPPVDDAGPAV